MKNLSKFILGALLFSCITCFDITSTITPKEKNVLQQVSSSSFSLNVIKDNFVTISSLPNKEYSGTRINFSLSYDSNTYRVVNVMINDDKPVKLSNNEYSFKMPEQNTIIKIIGEQINNAVNNKYSIINLNEDKDVVLNGLPEVASANQTLNFTIAFGWNSGYSFTNEVNIYKIDESLQPILDNKIECSYSAFTKTYSFTMPDHAIAINVGTTEKKFTLINDANSKDNVASIEYSIDGGTTFITSSNTSTNIPFGYPVKITLKHSATMLAKKLSLKTNTSLIEVPLNDLIGQFNMPSSNVSLVIEGDINYKSITVNNLESFNVLFLSKNEDDSYTILEDSNHFVPGEKVYFKIICNTDDYIATNVTVTNESNSITLSTINGEEKIYSFTMPNSDDVVISYAKKDVSLYKNYPFVGQFYGYNLYGSNLNATEKGSNSSYNLSVNGAGEFYKGTSTSITCMISSISHLNSGSNNGLISLSNNYDVIYTPNFIFGHYNLNSSFSSNYSNDFLLTTKSIKSTDTYANYCFTHLWSKGNFLAVQSYRIENNTSTYIASLFVDFTNKEYYGENLEFVLNEGSTSIASSTAKFDVMENGIKIGSVSNNTYTKA